MDSNTRREFEQAERQGWTVTQRGGKHQLMHPDAAYPVTCGVSLGGDPHNRQNFRSELRKSLRAGTTELEDSRERARQDALIIKSLRDDIENTAAEHRRATDELRGWLETAKAQVGQNDKAAEILEAVRNERDNALFRVLELEDEVKTLRTNLADAHSRLLELVLRRPTTIDQPPASIAAVALAGATPVPEMTHEPRRIGVATGRGSSQLWDWTPARESVLERIGRTAMPYADMAGELAKLPGRVGSVAALGQKLLKLRAQWRDQGVAYDSPRGGFIPAPSRPLAPAPAPVRTLPAPAPQPVLAPSPVSPEPVAAPARPVIRPYPSAPGRWDWTEDRMNVIRKYAGAPANIAKVAKELSRLPGERGTLKGVQQRFAKIREVEGIEIDRNKTLSERASQQRWEWTTKRAKTFNELCVARKTPVEVYQALSALPGQQGTLKGVQIRIQKWRTQS